MRFTLHVLHGLLIFLFFSCRNEGDTFIALPSSQTNIYFENDLARKEAFNILYYLYYYNGGGVSVGDINNDGLPDIYFTANNKSANKLYLNKGDFVFEDITDRAGVAGSADWCTGVTMADVNGDGFLDIYVSVISGSYGLRGHNQLFINNGNETFTDKSVDYGLNFSGLSTQAAFFDYDHDGDLDCYLLNQSQRPHQNVRDTSARRQVDAIAGDRLYQNNLLTKDGPGNEKFTDVSTAAGIFQSSLGYGLGIAVADLDNDGWEDIYIGNDFHENDYVYMNNGDGSFTESGAERFGHYSRFSMGNDIADYNGDGQLDIVTLDMLPPDEKGVKTLGSDENADIYKFKLESNGYQYQVSRNCLQRNNGNATGFSEVALSAGIAATDWSWSPLFADFDNDGLKDLFITSGIVKRPIDLDYIRFATDPLIRRTLYNSTEYDDRALALMPDGKSHLYFFRGNGRESFTDMSGDWGSREMSGYFTGAAYADLNNDGKLDLVVNPIHSPAVILKNNLPLKNFISIAFNGNGANRQGIGAKVYIFSGDKIQYQQLMLTRGFQSSSDARLHFGLDSLAKIDSLLVIWPDQQFQVLKEVPINQQLILTESGARDTFRYEKHFEPTPLRLTSLQEVALPKWKHQEDDFDDFNLQHLIPHRLSVNGPKLAVADVNGDGLDDVYACGGKGQPGALLIQQLSGKFQEMKIPDLEEDGNCEDTDALFFDANGDGYPDLYVVSGGNEYFEGDSLLLDRLYFNDGMGRFSRHADALPVFFSNKSCVAASDFDNDGDIDVFIGSLADSRAYGVPQTSWLLINDGGGRYSLAGPEIIILTNIGMVTSARFSDMDNDGWDDLIIAGEWMPVMVFFNRRGEFDKMPVVHSSGLWQTVTVDDVNKDGNMDILAGNWGWNNKFHSRKDGSLRLYVGDFDRNGRIDQLLSYVVDGNEYPFLTKDELERSLPALKKKFLKNAEFAGATMQVAFKGWIDSIIPLKADRLGSAIFYGDGKGGFTITDLPLNLQLSPTFSFLKLGEDSCGAVRFLTGGNFFGVIPYEGRYDAQALATFSVLTDSIHVDAPVGMQTLQGQVRDLIWLKRMEHRVVGVALNNDSLRFFKYMQTGVCR